MWNIRLQLHGGGRGGSAPEIKASAPGSTAVATLDNATEEERAKIRKKMAEARGRGFTNKTGGGVADSIKKALLGE